MSNSDGDDGSLCSFGKKYFEEIFSRSFSINLSFRNNFQVKRKGRVKREIECKEKNLSDSSGQNKDTREELDFQFDEELDVLPKTGRQHDFSEWYVKYLV